MREGLGTRLPIIRLRGDIKFNLIRNHALSLSLLCAVPTNDTTALSNQGKPYVAPGLDCNAIVLISVASQKVNKNGFI